MLPRPILRKGLLGRRLYRPSHSYCRHKVKHILILGRRCAVPENARPAYITSLIRHFEDLRDGTHGGSTSRKDKEAHFEKAVLLLAPIARQVLNEMNIDLLRGTGQLTESGLRGTPEGGVNHPWA